MYNLARRDLKQDKAGLGGSTKMYRKSELVLLQAIKLMDKHVSHLSMHTNPIIIFFLCWL
jgi:hypothetical protein